MGYSIRIPTRLSQLKYLEALVRGTKCLGGGGGGGGNQLMPRCRGGEGGGGGNQLMPRCLLKHFIFCV